MGIQQNILGNKQNIKVSVFRIISIGLLQSFQTYFFIRPS